MASAGDLGNVGTCSSMMSQSNLLQVGAGLWGLCTIQLALTSNFMIMIGLRASRLLCTGTSVSRISVEALFTGPV